MQFMHYRHSDIILEVNAGPYGVEQANRAVVVTTDPSRLPELSTWYLISNLPVPDHDRARTSGIAAATLAEIVGVYGLRMWVEQSYKQVKTTLGWAEYQVRSDRAICRHWTLVCCAFTFCWWHASCQSVNQQYPKETVQQGEPPNDGEQATREKKLQQSAKGVVAKSLATSSGLAGAVDTAVAILAGLVTTPTTTSLTRTA